jgi:tRNA pseudouridine38-40 synthase
MAHGGMRNLRLLIAYDGTGFHGWQRQPNAPTLQGLLEETIGKIIAEPVSVQGAGRTDAGVHASGQVANFLTACRIPCRNLQKALNDALPPTVRIRRVDEVAKDFHARYAARAKTYRYRICQQEVCPPFFWRFVFHYPYPLDDLRMAQAARLLEGEHDFTSFAASGGGDEEEEKPRSSVRNVLQSQIFRRRKPRMIVYQVTGSGFLHHMVRNLVGTLVEVGRGRRAPEDILRILQGRARSLAGPTAPAQGLCLVKVEYE